MKSSDGKLPKARGDASFRANGKVTASPKSDGSIITITEIKPTTDDKTDWQSIELISAITFASAVQFSIFFTSLWPYLQQVDIKATESFFGYITASYSLGQAIANPVFGFWSARINKTRLPVSFGLILMFVGNCLYLTIGLIKADQRYVMLISRFINGCGAGILSVLRSYAIMASSPRDRAKAISVNTGAMALGLSFGPAFQIAFSPLSYPGWRILGNIRLNMYTAPPIFCLLLNAAGLIFILTIFQENYVDVDRRAKLAQKQKNKNYRFFVLPKFDRFGAALCIAMRFVQMFVITNTETLVRITFLQHRHYQQIWSPYSMIIFGWTRAQAVLYNSIAHGCFGFFGFIIYVSYIIFNLNRWVNHRFVCLGGLALIIIFHLLTFPWWFLPGSIHYKSNSTGVNGEEVGCPLDFEWCSYTPPVNIYLFNIAYVLLIGAAFPAINISMNTIYSTLIGPRNQGSMQGILMFFGSTARLVGPVIVTQLFTVDGPRGAWIAELLVAAVVFILWVVMFKRMVPLKIYSKMHAGDVVRNKFGTVYRF